jgi:hypothetical protein
MRRPFLTSIALLCAALASGCSMFTPPAELDVRLNKQSNNHLYAVSMHQLQDNPAINQMHAWEIDVTTSDGRPVSDATFKVGGGMPQHHHGWPTEPQVTEILAPGRYVLDGVKFSMPGWWQFKIQVASSKGMDEVVFNTVVEVPAATSMHALASAK